MAKPRVFWAPGRVNLIGEYTDLAGGLVLPVALDLGIRIEAAAAERIRLRSESFETEVDLAADGSEVPADGWGRYVAAVAAELAALGRPPVGLQGFVSSTLPARAGLSSSAALEVAVAVSLCAVADFDVAPMDLAQAARRAEHRAVGVPCGIMDQAASLLGREGHALLLDTGSLLYEHVALPAGLDIVVIDSGVPRSLEHSAYAERREELQRGLAAARGRLDLSEDELDQVVARLDEAAGRRLMHVVSENRRVRRVVEALKADDAARLGRLFRAGHESLRDDLEVSIPALDALVELAYEEGAVAARMTGGGFGGAIVALVAAPDGQAFAARVTGRYAASGASGRAFICQSSAGAGEIPPRPSA